MRIYATTQLDSFERFINKPVWVRGTCTTDYDYTESEYFKFYRLTDGKLYVNMFPAECLDIGWKLTSSSDLWIVTSMFTDPLNPLNLYNVAELNIELDTPFEVLTEDEFKEILRNCCEGKVDI